MACPKLGEIFSSQTSLCFFFFLNTGKNLNINTKISAIEEFSPVEFRTAQMKEPGQTPEDKLM